MSHTAWNIEKIHVKPEIIRRDILITHTELEREKERQLKYIQKTAEIDGFRRGKVPIHIIKKRYNNTSFYEAFEHLLKEKAKEILQLEAKEPLFYVYNFEETGLIKDDGTDKKIGLEFITEPNVNVDIKNRELELVKYSFTERQQKILADILMLENFLLKSNPIDKLESTDDLFAVSLKLTSPVLLKNSEGASKNKEAEFHLFLYSYSYLSYGLNKLLPLPLEGGKVYSIELAKWLDILKDNFPTEQLDILMYLRWAQQHHETTIQVEVHEIHNFSSPTEHLSIEAFKQVFNLDETTEVTPDIIYNQLFDRINLIAEYYSGVENTQIFNRYMDNIVQVELPDNFVEKLYEHHEENKESISLHAFKENLIKDLKILVLKKLMPHVFNLGDGDELFTQITKNFIVKHMLFNHRLDNFQRMKERVLDFIYHAKKKGSSLKELVQMSSIFSLSERIEKDIKVIYRSENITATHLPFTEYFNITKNLFV